MALNKNGIQSNMLGELSSRGIVTGGAYGRAWIMPDAIADGVVTAITGTAIVVVPYRAGGSFPVTGLSSALMSSKIASVMTGNGIKLSGQYADGRFLPDIISNAVTAQVLGSCVVAVPTDGVGTFPVSGLSESALLADLEGRFKAAGFVFSGGHAHAGKLTAAIAKAVTDGVNGKATITGNWNYAAGTAPVE